jgi:hypothetical protein
VISSFVAVENVGNGILSGCEVDWYSPPTIRFIRVFPYPSFSALLTPIPTLLYPTLFLSPYYLLSLLLFLQKKKKKKEWKKTAPHSLTLLRPTGEARH